MVFGGCGKTPVFLSFWEVWPSHLASAGGSRQGVEKGTPGGSGGAPDRYWSIPFRGIQKNNEVFTREGCVTMRSVTHPSRVKASFFLKYLGRVCNFRGPEPKSARGAPSPGGGKTERKAGTVVEFHHKRAPSLEIYTS